MNTASKTASIGFTGFDGFDIPNGTYTPDIFFDYLAPHLSEAELRVLIYIIRRTFGFKKKSDAISLTQMVEGIKTKEGKILDYGTRMSRKGVMKGCAGLIAKGIITVNKRLSKQGDNEINIYSLKFKSEEGVGNNVPYGREPSTLGVGNNVHPQVTVVQETDLQYSNSNKKVIKSKNEPATRPRSGMERVGDRLKKTLEQLKEEGSIQIPLQDTVGRQEQVVNEKSDTIPRTIPTTTTAPSKTRNQRVITADEERRLYGIMTEVSAEFSDSQHIRSNKTQILNIFQQTHRLTVDELADAVYYAKGLTKEQAAAGAIRGSKMSYFFATLKDKLNLPRQSKLAKL